MLVAMVDPGEYVGVVRRLDGSVHSFLRRIAVHALEDVILIALLVGFAITFLIVRLACRRLRCFAIFPYAYTREFATCSQTEWGTQRSDRLISLELHNAAGRKSADECTPHAKALMCVTPVRQGYIPNYGFADSNEYESSSTVYDFASVPQADSEGYDSDDEGDGADTTRCSGYTFVELEAVHNFHSLGHKQKLSSRPLHHANRSDWDVSAHKDIEEEGTHPFTA
jgi:hypothetical protein